MMSLHDLPSNGNPGSTKGLGGDARMQFNY